MGESYAFATKHVFADVRISRASWQRWQRRRQERQLFAAIHGNQKAMVWIFPDERGTISPAEFLSPPTSRRSDFRAMENVSQYGTVPATPPSRRHRDSVGARRKTCCTTVIFLVVG